MDSFHMTKNMHTQEDMCCCHVTGRRVHRTICTAVTGQEEAQCCHATGGHALMLHDRKTWVGITRHMDKHCYHAIGGHALLWRETRTSKTGAQLSRDTKTDCWRCNEDMHWCPVTRGHTAVPWHENMHSCHVTRWSAPPSSWRGHALLWLYRHMPCCHVTQSIQSCQLTGRHTLLSRCTRTWTIVMWHEDKRCCDVTPEYVQLSRNTRYMHCCNVALGHALLSNNTETCTAVSWQALISHDTNTYILYTGDMNCCHGRTWISVFCCHVRGGTCR